jgi:hypothetical protein
MWGPNGRRVALAMLYAEMILVLAFPNDHLPQQMTPALHPPTEELPLPTAVTAARVSP